MRPICGNDARIILLEQWRFDTTIVSSYHVNVCTLYNVSISFPAFSLSFRLDNNRMSVQYESVGPIVNESNNGANSRRLPILALISMFCTTIRLFHLAAIFHLLHIYQIHFILLTKRILVSSIP